MADVKEWLEQQRAAFLDDFQKGDLKGWVVSTGNEAGGTQSAFFAEGSSSESDSADMDTLASSISFAYFSSQINKDSSLRYVPVQITPSDKFHLREENIRALETAGIPDYASVLVCSDTLGGADQLKALADKGAQFALVDQNELPGKIFGTGEVVAVIDHHVDQKLYPNANPRLIVGGPDPPAVGSCTSLVATYFKKTWPQDRPVPAPIADLLLSGILIDTGNLKPRPKGKATDTDIAAKDWLAPFSSMLMSSSGLNPSDAALALGQYFQTLSDLKKDVSRLNSRELLERDYKEYGPDEGSHGWAYGLSTVPMGLVEWTSRDGADFGGGWEGLFESLESFISDRGLDAFGILTSFEEPVPGKKHKGQHARQVVLLIKDRNLLPLFDGLPNDEDQPENLQLTPWPEDVQAATEGGRMARIWKMENTASTRKQVAPRMQRLVAELPQKGSN